ncbi:MAG TPA: VOC family protein [Thermoanaerobaculia bacterium]|nr:VOC family protein [Thermoanaerobaculia bacterium]
MKITPVLVVHAIEPVLPLWESLGFTRKVEVPHGESLGFVTLVKDDAEVMYQSVESVKEDEPLTLEGRSPVGGTALFIEVEDLDALRLPAETDVLVQRRTTFYGSKESIIRDAAGNVIVFAQF